MPTDIPTVIDTLRLDTGRRPRDDERTAGRTGIRGGAGGLVITNATVASAPSAPAPRLKQFVMKPTVYCYHRCPYCDLRQDYYGAMIDARKHGLRHLAAPGERITNPGHMPRDLALRLVEEAAAAGMKELQLSAATRCSTRT